MKNKVYLVGAGPGDTGLLTLKGKSCIEKADVIVYDYLAADELLKYARKDAELIYAGKKGGDHTLTQTRINDLLVEKAKQGHTVTRLKGGDPFIFGRGGEEIEALIEEGLAFEVVPGVTSAIAAPAYAGIPLTHRKFTSTVTFITGHEDPTKKDSSINWKALAENSGTLVFLMGVKNLPNIVTQLRQNGMAPKTPAALVRWGTTTKQQAVTGTLETITENVKAAGLKPPCIIVVGDVISLRKKMKWFENRPLFGKKIVVTRARAQASDMILQLTELGAQCLEYPVIKIVPPENYSAIDAAIENLDAYDWIIFTSVNGVEFFFKRLCQKGKDARSLGNLKTACIGPVTADQLKAYGINTDILPESYRAESIITAFKDETISGKRMLLPRAAEARPILPEELSRMGAKIDEIAAYHTVNDTENTDQLIRQLEQGDIDLITFTSSSTVTNFKKLIPHDRFESLLKDTTIASIGPITTETAGKNGFTVHVEAESYTIAGLCEAIVKYYSNGQ
ncbi:MAG: uroporphyrinogen-III C-methyltransferase [Desulfobacteraceae bacterium]|nr:uroporphyrinogen-III C-methyltransferase [Desulfobacteraceae bacterium]MBC2754951.1 uroporphyrinogen-III C-methyltransferase [Desulfobacteraceae bacterium]